MSFELTVNRNDREICNLCGEKLLEDDKTIELAVRSKRPGYFQSEKSQIWEMHWKCVDNMEYVDYLTEMMAMVGVAMSDLSKFSDIMETMRLEVDEDDR
jgi:hypothetical protein